ncbi:ABC transporter permease, partial [Armatimonas sp.]|uniref:ABC transporter permease n=1 Tax=Armatimonas sp. TaxID=1872638 RepID=UPI00374CE57E
MGWWHLLVKELIQLRRDWRLWPLLIGTPVFQLILFGYAVRTDIVHSRVVIADEDRTPTSRSVERALSSYEELDVLAVVPTRQEGYARLEAGTTDVLVLIPQGWEKNAQRGEARVLPVAIDGTDAMTATAIQGYLAGAVQSLSPRPAFPLHVRLRFNPNKESNFYIIPGVLAMLIGLLNTVLVALSVAKERELGTIEQLQVSPLSPGAFVAGKTVAFLLLGLLQLALILVTAQALFQLPLRGSLVALVGLSAIYISGYVAMGLIVASYCSNQQQAMLLS